MLPRPHADQPATRAEDDHHGLARRRLLLGGTGALLSLALGGCLSDSGVPLAGVTVQDLAGKPVDLESIKGKPTLITFWATTCPGCIKEIPHIKELHEKYASQGVNIVGLAMSYDPLDQINTMVENKDMNYTIWQDKDGLAAKAFGPVRVTPTTFVLDREARIEFQKIGVFDTERVEKILDRLTASS